MAGAARPARKASKTPSAELEGGARTVLRRRRACNAMRHRDPVGVQRGRSSAGGGQLSMSRPGISATRHSEALRRRDQLLRARPPTSRRYLKPNTKAVFCESPGSLTFEVQDIPAIAAAPRMRMARQRPDGQYLGDAAVVPGRWRMAWTSRSRRRTKYIGGHADVMMGYVTANESHAARLDADPWRYGPVLPAATIVSWRLRGLRTLRGPAEAASGNRAHAGPLAGEAGRKWRASCIPPCPPIPAMPCGSAISRAPAACSAVELKPVSEAAVAAFVDGLQHFGIGYSWGGFESLIVPAHIQRTAEPFDGGRAGPAHPCRPGGCGRSDRRPGTGLQAPERAQSDRHTQPCRLPVPAVKFDERRPGAGHRPVPLPPARC